MWRLWAWRNQKLSIGYLVIFIGVVLYGLWNKGLFFPPQQTIASAIALILLVLLLAVQLAVKQFRVTLWMLPLIAYLLFATLSVFWSVDKVLALSGVAIIAVGALFVVVLGTLKQNIHVILLWFLVAMGALLYVFCLGVAARVFTYQDAVQNQMMNSVFQYHNTFGTFELMTFLIAVILGVEVQGVVRRVLSLFAASLALSGVILSFSRWVWLLTVFMVLVALLGGAFVKRTRAMAIEIPVVTLGAMADVAFASNTLRHQSLKFAVLAVLFNVITIAVLAAGVRLLRMLKWSTGVKLISILIPIMLAGLITVTYWSKSISAESITMRLHTITLSNFSLQERLWYYGAALHMWIDSFWFGSGYGAWTTKFQAYQQFPYWATKTHSSIMSSLTDFGTVGSFLWLMSICTLFWYACRNLRSEKNIVTLACMMGFLAIFIHSFFDFDLDFPVVLWVCYALLGMAARGEINVPSFQLLQKPATRFILLAPLLVSCVIVGYLGIQLGRSQMAQRVASTEKPLPNVISNLRKAVSIAPYNNDATYQLASAYWENYLKLPNPENQSLAWNEIDRAATDNTWNPVVLQSCALAAYELGHTDTAYNWANRAAGDGPFTESYSELAIEVGLWTGVTNYATKPSQAVRIWTAVLKTYSTVNANIGRVHNLPSDIHEERPFTVSAQTKVYAASAMYCLQRYTDSLSLINSIPTAGLDPDTQGLVDIVKVLDKSRLGQASLRNVAEVFIKQDPRVQQEYQLLSNINAH